MCWIILPAAQTVTSGNGFLAHAGATGLSAMISLSNGAGTRSDLQVDSAPSIGSGTMSGGPATPYYVSAGSAQSYAATFNAGSTPGVFSDTVTFAFAGDNQSLSGASPLGPLSVSITGNVYSGQAEWNATSGTWGTAANWKDTVGGGPSWRRDFGLCHRHRDLRFGLPSGTGVVALDAAAPVLSNLIFSNSNASYWILQGTGTTGLTLTGTDDSSPAAVTVTSGTHVVDAPILLDSNLVVSSSGSLMLSGSLSDGGLGKSLTLDGGATDSGGHGQLHRRHDRQRRNAGPGFECRDSQRVELDGGDGPRGVWFAAGGRRSRAGAGAIGTGAAFGSASGRLRPGTMYSWLAEKKQGLN